MQRFNCLIVEDEPLAAEVLQDYIKQVPFLSLKGICNDAIFALEAVFLILYTQGGCSYTVGFH